MSSDERKQTAKDGSDGADRPPTAAAASYPYNNPETVHRILLTDPADFCSLTVSGEPRMTHTPSYDEFCDSLSPSNTTSNTTTSTALEELNTMMQSAARTVLCERILIVQQDGTTCNLDPLKHVLIELHNKLRLLIPSRTDLHSLYLMDDHTVLQATTTLALLQQATVTAARALVQLESPARSESTLAWIQSVADTIVTTNNETTDAADSTTTRSNVETLVTCIFYLLYKTQLCQTDKQDFLLGHVWAPRVLVQGRALEHAHFQARFGSFVTATTVAPATRQWIQSIVTTVAATTATTGNNERTNDRHLSDRDLLAIGWITDILFRAPDQAALALPEIWALDAALVVEIRNVTRLAAAGSALALQACTTAQQSTDILQDSAIIVDAQRKALVQAMREQWRPDYEQNVGNAVVGLALAACKPTSAISTTMLDEAATMSLRNRVTVTLRGKDPVLALLNDRMKECFCQVALRSHDNVVPTTLKSGSGGGGSSSVTTTSNTSKTTEKNAALQQATQIFASRGLAFYASDLAVAALRAVKVVDLAWALYGDVLLKDMIRDCRSSVVTK